MIIQNTHYIREVRNFKLKLITPIIMLTICFMVLSTGCEQGMQKPVMDVITPPDTKPETNIDKAREALNIVNQRRLTVQQMADESGDYSTVLIESETIFNEELGFRKGFWVELVDIYKNENSDNNEIIEGFDKLQDAFIQRLNDDTLELYYFEYIRTFDPLIIEYIRLSFVFPNMQEAGLLERFRQSVREEKVSLIFPDNFLLS